MTTEKQLYTSNQNREGGKFAAKGSAKKELRSIRLTEQDWNTLQLKAEAQGLSRTDLIERLCQGKFDDRAIILRALRAFIDRQESEFGSNVMQKNKQFSMDSRGWDYFKRFAYLIEHEPWELGIGED